jgi:transcriptional regulator with XRE-family HTH domain
MDAKRFLKIIGEKIRAIRKSRRISQEELAELSGLHPTYISDIENGKVNASVYSYFEISKGLGIPLSELLNISFEKTDREIEIGVAELLGFVRNLNRKKQVIFLSAAKGLIAGIEKAR